MSRYPGAELRLLPAGCNHSSGGMGPIHGVVIHVIVGGLNDADTVFHNPNWRASAHFGVDFDGHTVEWVDTADKAWAEAAGNPNWISVETAGRPEQPLTNAQLDACARIVGWAHSVYGFALQVTNDPNGYGVGTHQMGGMAWGGHSCPGVLRAGQRDEIVRRATGAPTPQPPPTPTPPPAAQEDDDMSQFWRGNAEPTVYERNAATKLLPLSASALKTLWDLGYGHTPIPPGHNLDAYWQSQNVPVVVVDQGVVNELK